jgi:hypothetical protein
MARSRPGRDKFPRRYKGKTSRYATFLGGALEGFVDESLIGLGLLGDEAAELGEETRGGHDMSCPYGICRETKTCFAGSPSRSDRDSRPSPGARRGSAAFVGREEKRCGPAGRIGKRSEERFLSAQADPSTALRTGSFRRSEGEEKIGLLRSK